MRDTATGGDGGNVTTKVIDKDIVIVGGGAAGAHAALRAHSEGANVLLVVKGFLGRSGCSIFAGNLQMVKASASPDEEKKWLQVRAKHMGHYLLDQDYVKRANLFTDREFYPEMERKGLYIRRTPDGTILTNVGRAHNMWAPKQGYSGTFVMQILRTEIFSKGWGA
jgi:succinate dehydrogenase/fumarate reductase flavoprotein subunit